MSMTLILASCFMMFGFAFSGLIMLNVDKQKKIAAARVDSVLRPHRSNREEEVLPGGIGRAVQETNLVALFFQLINHEPRRRPYYVLQLVPLLFLAIIPAFLAGFVVSRFLGTFGWIAAPLMFIWFCRSFHDWCENRTQQMLYTQFPDALATIVRTVRVGLPVVEALKVVAKESQQPTAREFNALVEHTAIGMPLDEALRDMAAFSGLPEYRFFATALSLQSQTGGALTETLENLAETIRKRVAIRMRAHALAAEARMSAYILGSLPIVTGGMLTVVSPNYISVLFTDPTGRNILFFGAAMLCVGAFTMHTMIRKSLS